MTEAYRIALKHSQSSAARAKHHYDKKARSIVLSPGDRVLVRNTEKGGPGKIHSYWEDTIYKVVNCLKEDRPVTQLKQEMVEVTRRLCMVLCYFLVMPSQ